MSSKLRRRLAEARPQPALGSRSRRALEPRFRFILPIRFRFAALVIAACALLTTGDTPAQTSEAPIPRGLGVPDPKAIDPLKEGALERAQAAHESLDHLRQATAQQTQRTLADLTSTPSPTEPDPRRPRFVYFTSRTCEHCDAALDELVKRFIDLHPEVAPEVVYLGNPLTEYPEASAVFITFADDVIARWRERIKDPAVLEAFKLAGKVEDRTGRVQVSFLTKEAESRGIDEVPAFLLARDGEERLAIGRPSDIQALEAALTDPPSSAIR